MIGSLDDGGVDEDGGLKELGSKKASASENDRCTVNADWPEESWEKDNWTRSVMSQSA